MKNAIPYSVSSFSPTRSLVHDWKIFINYMREAGLRHPLEMYKISLKGLKKKKMDTM